MASMSRIDGSPSLDPRAINLNLLPALEALLETRSVSAAARRTHVSQSAMSHTLSRLRAVLGDPLLVPEGRALVLSPHAQALLARLPEALDRLGEALAPRERFDPRTTRRTFRVATLDYFELVILEDVMAHLAAHAPHASLWVERVSTATLPALAAGEIDLALVGEASLPRLPTLARAELFRDPFAVMMRPGHPLARARTLTLDRYLSYPHVVVTVEGRVDGAVDRALEAHGRARHVSLRVPHFATAPLAILGSDALSTIASSVAARAHALYGVVVKAPPLTLPSANIVAVWPRRLEADEGARWLRSLFVDGTLRPRGLRRAR
jgi:DNA-binding transcriptional LysR family regulator